MGMYTELNISVNIEADANTLAILDYMVSDRECELTAKIPQHSFFKSCRWEYMLRSESFYFDHTADSSLVDKRGWDEDGHTDRILNVRCDLKNYTDEIQDFLSWIYPFTTTRGFIGYMRYEEDSNPTLIYFTDEGIKYRKV